MERSWEIVNIDFVCGCSSDLKLFCELCIVKVCIFQPYKILWMHMTIKWLKTTHNAYLGIENQLLASLGKTVSSALFLTLDIWLWEIQAGARDARDTL